MFGSSFIKLRCKTVSSTWPWELIWVEVQSLRFLLCFLYAKLNDWIGCGQRNNDILLPRSLKYNSPHCFYFFFTHSKGRKNRQFYLDWMKIYSYSHRHCTHYPHKMANANWLLILILLCLFVWNKIHSRKLWNRCQPNSSDTSKKTLLIYDTAVLMSRPWIVALLWLIFIKPLHSLIMHRSAWPISWMLW